jgi:hypothetical protein
MRTTPAADVIAVVGINVPEEMKLRARLRLVAYSHSGDVVALVGDVSRDPDDDAPRS